MKKKNDLLDKNVKQATKWSAISNITRKIITPVINIILARLLTPDAFGIVASINIIISFADMLTDTGFQKYLIQHDFDNKDELSKSANVAFWVNLVVSCVLLTLSAIFNNELANTIGCEGNGKILLFAAFSIPLTSFSSVQNALFGKEFDFKTIFIPQLIASLLPFLFLYRLRILHAVRYR